VILHLRSRKLGFLFKQWRRVIKEVVIPERRNTIKAIGLYTF